MFTITTVKEITTLDLPLPIYKREKVATARHEELGDFSIYVGLSREDVEQIKAYSLNLTDEALQKGTTDYERFGTGDYEERYRDKVRIQYILVHDETEKIASTIWYGPREMPNTAELEDDRKGGSSDDWYTSSYRTYGQFRGVGITTKFSLYILDLYKQCHPSKKMWLAVQKDNEPGVRMYNKLGFHTIGEDKTEGEHIMMMS